MCLYPLDLKIWVKMRSYIWNKQRASLCRRIVIITPHLSLLIICFMQINCLLSLCMCNCKNSVVLDGWPLFKLNWVRFGPHILCIYLFIGNIWESVWFDWIKRLKTNRVNLLFLYLLQQLYMHCIMSVGSSVPTPTAKSCNYDTKARRLDFPWSSS